MPATPYTDTIDWDRFWADADEDRRSDTNPSGDLVLDPLLEFIEATGVPDSYADVGCGPGAAVAAVADRYPDTTVVGYDAAAPVLAENRDRFDHLENLAFERTVLPAFDPDQTFDLVTSLFTLCYVADVETALRNLYDAVAPGGTLIVHYHNRLAHAHYRDIATDPHAVLDEDAPWDPDTFAERFRLVIEGENLLSYERIHDVLGTWPRSVFSVATGTDQYGAHRYEPLVYIPK